MPVQQPQPFTDLPYIGPTMPLDPVSTLNKDVGGPGSFSELLVGAGAKAFHADSSGWWQGAVKFADASARCDMNGNAVFNSILINGLAGSVIAGAIDANGNFIKEVISTNLNTQTKQILGSFTFGASGAIAIASDASNGLWLSPTGLLGKKAGATTFAIDTGGNATFGGTLVAAAGTLGTITAGTLNGVVLNASGKLVVGGDIVVGDYDGTHRGLMLDGGSFNNIFIKRSDGVIFFRVNQGGAHSMTFDSSSGVLSIRGSLNADDIVAGTITGRTLRTAAPAAGVGSSVVITGGNDEVINFYHNADHRGWIKGYTTEGSEVTYVEIGAVSGRKLKLKNSFVECNGNFNPSSSDAYNVGGSGMKWQEMWAGRYYQSTPTAGDVQVFSFAYVEMGLLPKGIIKKYLKGKAGCMRIDKVPEDEISLPFKKGTVLIWKNGKLQESEKEEDERVVAIADKRGLPIVLGAEPVNVIGKVNCGDYIVSAKNGCGKAAKNPNPNTVIGKALEGNNGGKNIIKVMIKF